MADKLRVLFIEDSADDAALLEFELRKGGFKVESLRVETRTEVEEALRDQTWDIVVSDFSLPHFGGTDAVRAVKAIDPDMPVIVATGHASEAVIVETMRAGAGDCFLKSNLMRLADSVRREVSEATMRREARATAETLQTTRAELARSEEEHGVVFTTVPDAIGIFDRHGTLLDVNPAACELTGYTRDELIGRRGADFLAPRYLAPFRRALDEGRAPDPFLVEAESARKDGRTIDVEIHAALTGGANDPRLLVVLRDITEHKRSDQALRESEERFRQFAENFPGLVFIKDFERRLVYLNQQFAEDFGILTADWLGRTGEEIWPADIAADVRAADESVLGGTPTVVSDDVRPGSDKVYLTYRFPLRVPGQETMIGAFAVDVTARKEAEAAAIESTRRLAQMVLDTVTAMGALIEGRDPYTAGHEKRVTTLAVRIAEELGLDEDVALGLRLAAEVHDIGRVAVPTEILNKPSKLSDLEFRLVKTHAEVGFDVLKPIEFDRPVAEIVRQHHERCDGSGYPRGLAGDEILPEARIVAVADVVEAMASHRPYRPALGLEAALDEIRAGSGALYDPEVAAACVRVVAEQGFVFEE